MLGHLLKSAFWWIFLKQYFLQLGLDVGKNMILYGKSDLKTTTTLSPLHYKRIYT